jgi:drug/metabolite transporter (DMT)-like permease
MTSPTAGVTLALSTAVVWAVSPLFMASVGRRIGSQNTNLLRALLAAIALAAVVLPAYCLVRRLAAQTGPLIWPNAAQCAWLMVSGTVGMVIGDACYYEALVLMGARRAVKLNTLAPVVALLAGWLAQGETLSQRATAGAALVIAAVMYATFANAAPADGENREPGRMSPLGLWCGVASAACIGLGSVTGRQAFKIAPLDTITATVVRVGFAATVLWLVAVARGKARQTLARLHDPMVRTRLAWGTLLGPIVGMLCFVGSLKFAPAGLVSTLISTSPLVILPIAAVKYGVRIRPGVVVALIVAVVGVGMISWKEDEGVQRPAPATTAAASAEHAH